MKYEIVYDAWGRLRLRCGQYAFSKKQGYGIESLLSSEKGVTEVQTNCVNGGILVQYEEGNRERILEIISGLKRGELAEAEPSSETQLREIDQQFKKSLVKMIVRRYVIRPLLPAPVRLLTTVVKALGYWRRAAVSLMQGRLDVDVLDGASIAAAFIQRDQKTAGSIMFLLSVSDLLEDYTHRRMRSALTQSLAVNVDSVWLCNEDETEVSCPIEKVAVGDRIRVRSGSVIPLDGTVTEGEAMVNESSMTGEPLAVQRRPGSSVYAGTVVEEGSIVISVTALASDTRINKIIDLIDQSEMMKAGVQCRAESLADSIVPFSFLGAGLVFGFTRNLTKALSVLMVDYSCAIKLCTPISVISAMREASNKKMVVKGGKYLEAFAKADTIVFDKTGTLTAACPRVSKVYAFEPYSRNEVLKIAACIEEHFPHSMAKAVVRQAQKENLRHEEEHSEVEYVVAHGVVTTMKGRRALIGSRHFIVEDEQIQITEEQQHLIDLEFNGCSLLYLAIGDELAGIIGIDDPPREDAPQVIQKLKKCGFKNLIMMTGDSESAAREVSRKVGITQWYSQVLPEDKSAMIERLKAEGHTVIMVGDGVNDSPALAAADVSVAVKDGSDIAREVADITFLTSDLEHLVVMRELSEKLFLRIERNYRFILTFNTGLLLFGLLGILAPSATALFHNVSTMGISALSMRPFLESNKDKKKLTE